MVIKKWWLFLLVIFLVQCPKNEPKNGTEEISLQPGPEGTDVWITSVFDYGDDYGVNNEWLQVGGWGDYYYSLIKFNLNGLPKVATKVTLWLYCLDREDLSTPMEMSLYSVLTDWDENTGWFNQPSIGFYLGDVPAPVEESWYTLDITGIYNAWQGGLANNHGVELRPLFTNNQFSVFASSDHPNASIRPILVVEYESGNQPFRLLFPLSGQSPYTVETVAVFDNDRRRGVVKAYNGEIGSVEPYVYGSGRSRVIGYKKEDRSDFILDLLKGYDDQVPGSSGKGYLFYDGHSGYDYPMPIGTFILAAEDGQLTIATIVIQPSSANGGLWRNDGIYQLPTGMDDQWIANHAVLIKHNDTEYSTWYLHVLDLEPSVKAEIINQGYVAVFKSQIIAYVGDYGVPGRPHLHFGIRQGEKLIDPYGTGEVTTTVRPKSNDLGLFYKF